MLTGCTVSATGRPVAVLDLGHQQPPCTEAAAGPRRKDSSSTTPTRPNRASTPCSRPWWGSATPTRPSNSSAKPNDAGPPVPPHDADHHSDPRRRRRLCLPARDGSAQQRHHRRAVVWIRHDEPSGRGRREDRRGCVALSSPSGAGGARTLGQRIRDSGFALNIRNDR